MNMWLQQSISLRYK